MEANIVLDSRKHVRLPETLIAGQNVIIALESSIYELGLLAVTINNGHKCDTIVLEGDNKLDISPYLDRACKVKIMAELIIKGHTVKKWVLEPIVVREVDQEFESIPLIVDFERRLERMENIVLEFNKKLNESL
jgi:hypothetical protein